MADALIENPIPNTPFAAPARHFKFTDEGITNEIVDGRRNSSYFVPIALLVIYIVRRTRLLITATTRPTLIRGLGTGRTTKSKDANAPRSLKGAAIEANACRPGQR
jgi:hypothetical protein